MTISQIIASVDELRPNAFSAAQKVVDLVPGDEKTPLGGVPFGGGKVQRFPLQVGKLLQQFLRTVEMESQQFPVLSVCLDKLLQFIPYGLERLRVV